MAFQLTQNPGVAPLGVSFGPGSQAMTPTTMAPSVEDRINQQLGDLELQAGQQRQQQSAQLFELLFGGGDGGGGFFQDVFTPAFQGLTGAAEGAIGSVGEGGPGGALGQPGGPESPGGPLGQPGGPESPGGGFAGPIPGGNLGAFALGREQQALGLAQQFGDSQRARIDRDFDASVGTAMSRLEQGGLGSSNLTPAALSQAEEARQQSMLGLEDALIGQQLGIIQNTTGQVLETGAQDKQIASGLIGSLLGGIF